MKRSIFLTVALIMLLPAAPSSAFQQSKNSFRSVLENAFSPAVPKPIIDTGNQGAEDPEGGCTTDSVILNTGYNHNTSTAYPVNFPDSRWTVLLDTDSNTAEPGPPAPF